MSAPDDALESLRPRFARWAAALRRTGWDSFALTMLDAGEPLAPLGAQALYFLAPALMVFAPRDAVQEIAQVLEAPGGIEWLRQVLGTH